jgi:hypothetical protein
VSELIRLLSDHKDVANVLAAAASAVAAFLSAVVAGFAFWVARSTLKHQRKHNVLSLRPIAEVTVGDWETKLRVTLKNNGAGPLVVTRLVAGNGGEVRASLLDWMPDLPEGVYWSNFAGNIDGRSLSPDRAIVLLELDGDATDRTFAVFRDHARAALHPLTLNVEYTDVYDSCLHPYRKSLEWFGRRLGDEQS